MAARCAPKSAAGSASGFVVGFGGAAVGGPSPSARAAGAASVEVAVRSGVDFPWLLYQWGTGQPIDRVSGYRTGGWMRFLQGDIRTTVASLRGRGRPGIPPPIQAVRDFSLAFFRPTGYDYLDWQDPLPAAKSAANFARFAMGNLMNTIRFRVRSAGKR